MSSLKNVALAVSAGLALAAGAAAHANVIAPGGSGAPDVLPFTGTTIAGKSGTFTSNLGASDFSGSYQEYVLRGDVYGANDLAWYIEVTNNDTTGAADIQSVSASSFTGFLTDVGYCQISSCANEGSVLPTGVSRTSNGAAINFYLTLPPDGSTTDWLMIETNAQFYAAGNLSFQNSGVALVSAFKPVPEPSTWALMLVGLGGLGFASYKARKGRLTV